MLKQVAEAREHGDLSENAEYHAAREELTRIHAKIYKLEQTLSNVQLIDENSIDTDQVRILTTVRIQEHSKKQQRQYTLVAQEEADPTIGKISVQSPVGRGLIGKKVGDRVTIQIPAGKVEWTILEILPPRTSGGS
jgi:transcription elongation factor GreA